MLPRSLYPRPRVCRRRRALRGGHSFMPRSLYPRSRVRRCRRALRGGHSFIRWRRSPPVSNFANVACQFATQSLGILHAQSGRLG